MNNYRYDSKLFSPLVSSMHTVGGWGVSGRGYPTTSAGQLCM